MDIAPDATTPLYLRVAHHIERSIAGGLYPIGTLLPPEAELALQLGVSRHTLREAIARLRRAGQLSARKGVGTRVEQVATDWRSRFRAESRNDLFDFARETELHFRERRTVAVRGQLALDMACRPGRKWAYLAGPRYFTGETTPFCWNEVYLDMRMARIVRDIEVLRVALFMLVETHTGERIAEIQQEIRPVRIEDDIAPHLGLAPGELGLQLTRRYLGTGRRLLEYAIQTLPAHSFVYRTSLASDAG